MLAGEPGAFKSVFALNICTFWARQGLGILYFSADGDELTVLRREVSIMTGADHASNYGMLASARSLLREYQHVKFVYEADGTIGMVDEYVVAYDAMEGKRPDVVVIDNAMDFSESAAEEFFSLRQLLKDSVKLASTTNSHVMVLHHAKLHKPTQEYPVGAPPPAHEIQFQITQKPALILTLGALGDRVGVAVVKNRHGRSDPAARNPLWFTVNPAMQVNEDLRQEVLA